MARRNPFSSSRRLQCPLMLLIVVASFLVSTASACTMTSPLSVTAKWHEAPWTDCTGFGGLPGPADTVVVEGPHTLIIDAETEVDVAGLQLGSSALIRSSGSITVNKLNMVGSTLESDGELAIRGDACSLSMNGAILTHSGNLTIIQPRTSAATVAPDTISSSELTVGGLFIHKLEVDLTVTDDAFITVDSGMTIIGHGLVKVNLTALVRDIWQLRVHGNMIVTSVASDVSLTVTGYTVTILGDLELYSGDGDIASGHVDLTMDNSKMQIAGDATIKSGNVMAGTLAKPGTVRVTLRSCTLHVTGVDELSKVLVASGDGGSNDVPPIVQDIDNSFHSVVVWIQDTMLNVSKDLHIVGGSGDNGEQGGNGGSVFLRQAEMNQVDVGGSLILTGGNGGNSTSGQGGSSGGSFFYATFLNFLQVQGDLLLSSGDAGEGVTGGDSLTSFFAALPDFGVPFSNIINATNLTIRHGSAGSSTGGGSGGRCTTWWVLPEDMPGPGPGPFPIGNRQYPPIPKTGASAVTVSTLVQVRGDLQIHGCNCGDGLDGDGGGCEASPAYLYAENGFLEIDGDLVVKGGRGGDARGSASDAGLLLKGGESTPILLTLLGVGVEISGDIIINQAPGGDVVNASGKAGSQVATAVISMSSDLSIFGDVRISGSASGGVLADAVAGSVGTAGSTGSSLVMLLESELEIQGNMIIKGSDAGPVLTNAKPTDNDARHWSNELVETYWGRLMERILSAIPPHDERQFLPTGLEIVALLAVNSEASIGGNVTLLGGVGSSATVNDGTDSPSILISTDSTVLNLNSSIEVVSGPGGTSEQGYGGSAGVVYLQFASSDVTTHDVRLAGGAAGQGATKELDGGFGLVAFFVGYSSDYAQLGSLIALEGTYRDYNVSAAAAEKAAYDRLMGPPTSAMHVGYKSSWTIYPCAAGGITYNSRISSSFFVADNSTFRDCRCSGTPVSFLPKADNSSDISCLGCKCSAEVLRVDVCPPYADDDCNNNGGGGGGGGGDASTLRSTLMEVTTAIIELLWSL